MKRSVFVVVCALFMAQGPFGDQARAENLNDSVQGKLASLSSVACCEDDCDTCCDTGCNSSCDSCSGMGCGSCCCASGGMFIGFEAVIAKPYFSDEVDDEFEPGYDHDFSPRVWLGYRNARDLGVRVRYWDADWKSSEPMVFFNGALPLSLDLTTVDLEATQLVNLGRVNFDFFGGLRWAKAEHKDSDMMGRYTEGGGLTLGMEGIIPSKRTNLALVGNVRASYLFGDAYLSNDYGNDTGSKKDDTFSIYEAQIGIQWSRVGNHGGLWSMRGMIETQTWDSVVHDPNDYLHGDSEDLGIFGGTFRIMYAR